MVYKNTALIYSRPKDVYNRIGIDVMKDPAKEALYLSDSFIPTIAKATVDGVMVLDREHKILWTNEAILMKTGLSRREILGRYCYQVSHNTLGPCDSPESPCPMKETLRTKKSAHAIHEHILNDRTSYCDVSTFPLFDSNGNVIQVLEVLRDITQELTDRLEKRELSIKKDLSRLVLEDKLISLGKLVASVAHEINNPIAAILNFNKLILKTIKEGSPSDQDLTDFQKYLEYAVQEAEKCGTVVSNLLSFSRQKNLEVGSVDLEEMINRVITLMQHTMALSSIKIHVDIKTSPILFQGDATQIQQCMTNFIFNAIEALPDGGDIFIRAGNDIEGGLVFFDIQDTGVGISKLDIDRIFEPFFTTKAATSGVGLGLSIVYGIIKNHNGTIDVKSEPGKGTCFRVILPESPDKAAHAFTPE